MKLFIVQSVSCYDYICICLPYKVYTEILTLLMQAEILIFQLNDFGIAILKLFNLHVSKPNLPVKPSN